MPGQARHDSLVSSETKAIAAQRILFTIKIERAFFLFFQGHQHDR
jgi:hypothetical protein